MDKLFLPRTSLQTLIDQLRSNGFRVIGPQIKDHAIVFDTLYTVAQLPQAYGDDQQPGKYSLAKQKHERWFAWANTAQSVKPWLFKPEQSLWKIKRDAQGVWKVESMPTEAEPVAVIGVRACDLAGIRLQDQHFLQRGVFDPYYQERRKNLFLVAVNCTHPANTCFCVSTGDGPEATLGYDIALTELENGFVIQSASEIGFRIVEALPTHRVTAEQLATEQQSIAEAAKQLRHVPKNSRQALLDYKDDTRWNDIAETCLACGNCTAVCPTCFCHSEDDVGDFNLREAEHIRQWSSCFTQQHSYIHGLTVRPTIALRYKQWLTHKFSSWHDQYGRSGCVGCGRCMTWCPVAIDVTAELEKFEHANAN